jgi:hypothetical protein
MFCIAYELPSDPVATAATPVLCDRSNCNSSGKAAIGHAEPITSLLLLLPLLLLLLLLLHICCCDSYLC